MDKDCNLQQICRVCSTRASYDVFQPIPAYLHETDIEFTRWRRPISYYLQVILEQPVRINDGFPEKICVLCISYMKHAYNFKVQALKNLERFSGNKMTRILDVAAVDAKSRPTVDLAPAVQELGNILGTTRKNEMDDSLFTYSHTNFEEDDVTPTLEDCSLHLPETIKERKCISCKRRFMFEESYDEHVKGCMELKFLQFIRELDQLVYLKENRSLSSHEFIRRVIFALHTAVIKVVDYENGIKKNLLLQPETETELLVPSSIIPKIPNSVITKINVQDIFSEMSSTASSPLCELSMRCPTCDSRFECLTDLETHNFQMHNRQVSGGGNRRKVLHQRPVFPRGSIDTESSAPEMNNCDPRIRLPAKVLNTDNTQLLMMIKNNLDESDTEAKRRAKCPKCDAQFPTITHLDVHVAKKHSKST